MPGKDRAPSQDVDATELVASYLISQEGGQLDYMFPAHTLQLTHTHPHILYNHSQPFNLRESLVGKTTLYNTPAT